jgi:exopolyphosphatase/guanosine-5'-triphosphate,3'-diphosphate pyrophosphatase
VWEHPLVRSLREARSDDRPFAVVDVGSNSARMIVFRLRPGEHLDVLEDARAPLRLGRELRDDDQLGREAVDRTLEALRDFRAIADGAGAERMIAVATSAVREARDGERLLVEARSVGIPLEVIDGDAEAMFGFLGAVHDLPVHHGVAMDLGGGSMELTSFQTRRFARSWTFPLGSLRVSDRYLISDPPEDRELKDIRKAVKATLEQAGVAEVDGDGHLIGMGGTVRNLAKMDLRRSDHPLHLLHGYELRVEHIEEIVGDLAARTMKRRARLRGLNPDRADSIVGGAVVTLAVMRHLGVEQLMVSSRGLREGLALGEPGSIPTPREVRGISVATLASRFATWDAFAAARRTSLASQLIEALDPDATSFVKELLSHASALLDIGKAIDHYERWDHTAMIVTTADLAGFSHGGLVALSTILRHAGEHTSLGPYARLIPPEDRPALRRAAVALVLAEELLRRIPAGESATITCTRRRGRFEVQAPVPAGWRPRTILDRFRGAFGTKLSIVAAPEPPSPRPRIAAD